MQRALAKEKINCDLTYRFIERKIVGKEIASLPESGRTKVPLLAKRRAECPASPDDEDDATGCRKRNRMVCFLLVVVLKV